MNIEKQQEHDLFIVTVFLLLNYKKSTRHYLHLELPRTPWSRLSSLENS